MCLFLLQKQLAIYNEFFFKVCLFPVTCNNLIGRILIACLFSWTIKLVGFHLFHQKHLPSIAPPNMGFLVWREAVLTPCTCLSRVPSKGDSRNTDGWRKYPRAHSCDWEHLRDGPAQWGRVWTPETASVYHNSPGGLLSAACRYMWAVTEGKNLFGGSKERFGSLIIEKAPFTSGLHLLSWMHLGKVELSGSGSHIVNKRWKSP